MKDRNPFQVNILITPLNSWLLCLSLCCLLSPVWGQSFPAAPNDFVIEQIKRLHKDPKLVIYESKRALARESSKRRKIELNYILALSHIKLAQLTEAENFVFRGLENSNATTFPLMYHRLLLAKAQIMNKRGKPGEGLALAEVVAKWATTQNIVQLNIGALMTGALMDWRLGFKQTALGKFTEAYHLATTNKTQVPAPHIAGHIGRIHTELKEPKIAIPYLQQWLKFAKGKNNKLLQRTALIELSKAFKLNNDFEQSHQLLSESRQIASDMRDLNAIAKIDFELAELEKAQNELNKALNHYSKVISLANKFEDPELIFETYFGLAQTHLKLGNIEESRRYFEQAETKAKFLDIEELSHRIQKFKARLLFAEGQLLEAFSALDNGIKMEKQFSSGENQKALLSLRTQFNTAYQEAENARLRQLSEVHKQQLESEKLTNYLMVLIIFLLISVCGLFYLLYLKKQKYLLKLENSINTDLLTQLGSRRFILETLDQLVEKLNNPVSISTGGQKTESAADHIDVLTLAMLDMDFFKSINDKFGHLAGDDVLKCFGKIAKEHFSDDVFLGRMGGEEFLFIFPQKSASQCLEVLESFRIKIPSISKQLDSVENAHKISISIGMFEVARGGNRVRALNRVDDALLEAKENGRDRVVIAQSEDEFFAAIAKRSPSI